MAGSVEALSLRKIRIPTVPLEPAQSAIVSTTAGSVGSTGLTSLKRVGCAAKVTGDQMVAAMDAVGVDGAILVSPFSMYRYMPATRSKSLRGAVQSADPGAVGVVAFVGVDLGIQYRHD